MSDLIHRLPRLLLLVLGALGLSVLTLAGCGATQPEDDIGETEFTFLLNGERWTANVPTQAILSGYGIVIFSTLEFNDRFPLRQAVGFGAAWRGVGVYPIALRTEDGQVYSGYVNESDGDATIAHYRPVGASAEQSGFEITRYDETTGEVEGRFEGVFAVDPNYVRVTRRELPDTLRVTEGRFRAIVEDRR